MDRSGQPLRNHNSAAVAVEQGSSVHGLLPLNVVLIAVSGCEALALIDGRPMICDTRELALLHAAGQARCMCGRCSEAVLQ
jgi:hypothetical protein